VGPGGRRLRSRSLRDDPGLDQHVPEFCLDASGRVHRLDLRPDAELHPGVDRVRDLLRRGRARLVADPASDAAGSARGGGESGAERLLELRADLRALRGLTRAGAAAAHAGFRGLERESAEHRAAAVTLQGRDRLVEMRADERAPIARRAPHAAVDLAASVARLVAFPGRIDPTA